MTIRFANTNKFASGVAIAAAIGAAGLGFGSGTAQADTPIPDPHHVVVRIFDHINTQIGHINDRVMNRFDRNCAFIDRRIDRHFEGGLADRVVDHVCGTM
jgi:hypothetical protein